VTATSETGTAVIVAAYNAQATLERAVSSALAQPETAEVCIVDDKSTDDTLALARHLARREPRISVISFSQNRGPAAARNAAMDATKAPWVTILDADDYFLDGRLARLHTHAANADFVADDLLRVLPDEKPSAVAADFAPEMLTLEGFAVGNVRPPEGRHDFGFLKPMFRRAFVVEKRLRYREDLRLGEDYLFYASALALGARWVLGNASGYVSVERAGSLSKAHGERELLLHRDSNHDIERLAPLTEAERRAVREHWHSVDQRLQWLRLIRAVKERDVRTAISTFHTPQAALYLMARLSEQAWLRLVLRRRPE
jgi:succinoglycan biosynthesis protein ExoU